MYVLSRVALFTVALVLLATFVAGCGSSKDAVGSKATSEATEFFSIAEVREAFAGQGSPLVVHKFEGGVFVPSDPEAPLPLAELAPSGSPSNYYILIYESAREAAQAERAPRVDPLLGQTREFIRRANVLAAVQPPTEGTVDLVRAAFAEF
jgi:hypothetical protein